MTRRNVRSRFMRFAAAVAIGGSVFQLSGCDPNVRSALLTGLQTTSSSLANTLLSAFFLSLEDDEAAGSTTGLTTT